jgi:hypothetical protein
VISKGDFGNQMADLKLNKNQEVFLGAKHNFFSSQKITFVRFCPKRVCRKKK